ncbi:unnamed protein product [Vitrella brassicaformis CCMP3155]|uniref:Uncharacterized protein n=2 Tax=Vitrella brassicaformis TaxID=1169539 RepID=A0A0G4ESX1_VITBC|nr:unnamed protein product [Vitrella brassicaformis CCMP3155]|mmetsp:Transcript_5479/g.15268  ORF Transcript_5479/g.15268 Transcript_5479/m.15268 type:complete len:399 (-) Transcript_5479:31-1227(-)|eukprot:CEM00811.1 unnamed protein product [Vitrella brassicaformis CCMP3155]
MTSLRCGAFSLFRPRFSASKSLPSFYSAGQLSWPPRTDIVPDMFANNTAFTIGPELIDATDAVEMQTLKVSIDYTTGSVQEMDYGDYNYTESSEHFRSLKDHLTGLLDAQEQLRKLIQKQSSESTGVPPAFMEIFHTDASLHPLQLSFQTAFARLWRDTYGQSPHREVNSVLKQLTERWLGVGRDLFVLYSLGSLTYVNKALASPEKRWTDAAAAHRIATLFRVFFRSDLTHLDSLVPSSLDDYDDVYRIATASRRLIDLAYQKGMRVSWPTFASTTLSESLGKNFTGGLAEKIATVNFDVRPGRHGGGFKFSMPWGLAYMNVFFRISLEPCRQQQRVHVYAPRLLSRISFYTHEEEILLPPLYPLRVVNLKTEKGGRSGPQFHISLATDCTAAPRSE